MPSIARLHQLVAHHATTWPFETFDVFLTGTNDLSPAGLECKLAGHTRGGWCFELNEWLALSLEKEGFGLRRLMARNVRVPDRPRSHQVLLVEAEGRAWIADAGFGPQTPQGALPLDGTEVNHGGTRFRVAASEPGSGLLGEPAAWVVQTRHEASWVNLYRFTLESFSAVDFSVANHYHLTHPGSSFADTRFVSLPQNGGRLSVTDLNLKSWKATPDGEVLISDRLLTSVSEYREVLAEQFHVELTQGQAESLFELRPSVSRQSPLAAANSSVS